MRTSEKLIFERPNENDYHRFYEINSDPETNLFNPHGAMSDETAKIAFENILKHWEENSFGAWKISEIEHPNFVIGFGGISERKYGENTRINLGYRFDKDYWGRGYATELAKHAIEYAFKDLNFCDVYALVRPKNLASIRVLEKCQMKLFGHLADVPNDESSWVYKIEKKQ